jgi:hypothetical protein
MELDSSSEEEDTNWSWGGSVKGRKKVDRDFKGAHNNLLKTYFSGQNSVYISTTVFERRFGMPRVIFNQVFEALKDRDSFKRKWNPVNKEWGVYPLVQMLVYASPADRMDETFQMGSWYINVRIAVRALTWIFFAIISFFSTSLWFIDHSLVFSTILWFFLVSFSATRSLNRSKQSLTSVISFVMSIRQSCLSSFLSTTRFTHLSLSASRKVRLFHSPKH